MTEGTPPEPVEDLDARLRRARAARQPPADTPAARTGTPGKGLGMAMRIGTESHKLSQAMYLAEQQMVLFYVAAPTAAGTFQDPGNPIEVAANDDDLTTFNRNWTVQTDTPSVGLTTVSIQVIWNNPTSNSAQAGRRNVTLQGILGP